MKHASIKNVEILDQKFVDFIMLYVKSLITVRFIIASLDITGDSFTRCYPIQPPSAEAPPSNPCIPSFFEHNAVCQVKGEIPSCSCLLDFIETPSNCRPGCVVNDDCSNNLACINRKCKDPCPGSCAANDLY